MFNMIREWYEDVTFLYRKRGFMKTAGVNGIVEVDRDDVEYMFFLIGEINKPSKTLLAHVGDDDIVYIQFRKKNGESMSYTYNSTSLYETLQKMFIWVDTPDIKGIIDIDDWTVAVSVYSTDGCLVEFENRYFRY